MTATKPMDSANVKTAPVSRIPPAVRYWGIFLLLLFTAPVPLYLSDLGLVPPARILQLSGHLLYLLVIEKAVSTTVIITTTLALQGLTYTLLCLWCAGKVNRLLHRHPAQLITALLLAAVWLAAASTLTVYSDLFLPETSAASLLTVYN